MNPILSFIALKIPRDGVATHGDPSDPSRASVANFLSRRKSPSCPREAAADPETIASRGPPDKSAQGPSKLSVLC
jgi:hypothetical protein